MNFLNKEGLEKLWQQITTKLEDKVEIEKNKGLSTNDFTNENKNKLDGIEYRATRVIVENTYDSTSENAASGKAIGEALENSEMIKYIEQTLTEEQKTQARANIGAGTSNFDGDYSSLSNTPSLYTQEEVDAMLANKADKPADTSEVIVDNQEPNDYNLQGFAYTLPSDNTVITVEGWGFPDHIIMNAIEDSEYGGWYGDTYSLSTVDTNLSLPAMLPTEVQAQWKAGTTIYVAYNSDIITSAIATYSGGSYMTESEVDAKIEEYINEAILGGSW